MKRLFFTVLLVISCVICLACNSNNSSSQDSLPNPSTSRWDLAKAKDGTWIAESEPHKSYGKSYVEITIRDHKIVNVKHIGIDKEGNVKDNSYGAEKEPSSKKKAETAYKALQYYAEQLQEKESIEKVDAITGATLSYEQFKEASQKAIDKASN